MTTRPTVTVIGLGPGGADHVTVETLDAIGRVPVRFVRTTRHPSVQLLGSVTSFDDVYESADRFDDVYTEIVERLVAAAIEHGEVLYAVPGSPIVLERSVAKLRADDRVQAVILPAMSFLDVVWARLGVDPVEAAVRLIDGHEFAAAARGERGPLLITHTHANWVLSDIKLAVENAAGDEPVTILQRLGASDEVITETTWADLDRTVDADHLTCVYVPRLSRPVGDHYARFHELARTLRERCPWDREQTHATLVPYLVEEAFELVDALQALDPDDPSTDAHVIEELGDLLYHIEFHSMIAEQDGRFSVVDVVDGIHDKLVRRHPHVFGDVEAHDADTVVANWDEIKHREKQRDSIFDGVATSQPALSYAQQVQRKAAKVGFDWDDVGGPLDKASEELDELHEAIGERSEAAIAEELGDLLFAVVNAARHVGVDAELALRNAAHKFRDRFNAVEELARQRDFDLKAADLATLDALWDEVKSGEKPRRSTSP